MVFIPYIYTHAEQTEADRAAALQQSQTAQTAAEVFTAEREKKQSSSTAADSREQRYTDRP